MPHFSQCTSVFSRWFASICLLMSVFLFTAPQATHVQKPPPWFTIWESVNMFKWPGAAKVYWRERTNVSVKVIYLKYYWSKYRSMQNNSLWTFSFVVVKGLLRTEFLVAVGTRIHKKVGEMNCFNVIFHTCGRFVRKFEANSTSGYVFIISDQEFQQVIWILDVSWINTKRLTWF